MGPSKTRGVFMASMALRYNICKEIILRMFLKGYSYHKRKGKWFIDDGR